MNKSKEVKWDTSLGLDYSANLKRPQTYKPHIFPPLFKNTKLLSQSDLEGRGDTFQLVKQGDYAYVCHMFSSGFSVVDVKDPTKPEVVNFISTGDPHTWHIKCRVLGNLLLVAQEWKFFEPDKHIVNPTLPHGDRGPKEPVEVGLKVFDISKPAEPKLLSFFKTGGWLKEGGGVECHRFWYDGHYAYLSADMPGYQGRILEIVDVSNPKVPREVSKFWMPGQWIAGGERPTASSQQCLHLGIGIGDRCYTAWFIGGGGAILDISNIKRPTLISEFNYSPQRFLGGHTFLPIKDRQFAIFIVEVTSTYMLDINDEKYPKVVAMFPRPPKELAERGSSRSPWRPSIHNIHENTPGPDSFRSDDRIYATAGAGGLRIYDVSDPYRIEEIGYYVPGTPKAQYDPRSLASGVSVADVYIDKKGLIYLSSYNGGLEILEFTG